MSVPIGFFTDLLDQAGVQANGEVFVEVVDADVDLHENADLTTFDVTAALLDGGAEDGHVEEGEWN